MKLALLGATGGVGSFLLQEAFARGHALTAIARTIPLVSSHPRVQPVRGDLTDAPAIAQQLAGHDAVISAVPFRAFAPADLLGAIKAARVSRLLVVGGAGSLELAPGQRVVDSPDFPPEFRDEALAGAALLDALRAEPELDWTFLSPSAELYSGARTGKFRLGGDQLLVNAQGESRITVQDYAIALLDEVEQPRHRRKRFTVGY